jgi:hypothetical protein
MSLQESVLENKVRMTLPHYGEVQNAVVEEIFRADCGWLNAPYQKQFSSNINYAKLTRATHVAIRFQDRWDVSHLADFSLGELM